MVIPGLITVLIWRSFFFEATAGYLNQFLDWTGLMGLLQHGGTYVSAKLADPATTGLAKSFLESFDWLTAFKAGTAPAWLGDPKIIIIACVVWGFPWVGSFAVLTHLAKLQNISKDIYEAADIDAPRGGRASPRSSCAAEGSIYLLLSSPHRHHQGRRMILAPRGITGGPGRKANGARAVQAAEGFMDQQMGTLRRRHRADRRGVLLQKICNMLLQRNPKAAPSPQVRVVRHPALYAFAEATVLQGRAAAQGGHAGDLRRVRRRPRPQAGGLVAVPVLRRKFRRGAAQRPVLVGAALIAASISAAGLPWMLFGFALLLMLSSSIFKVAIGVAGAILIGYGATATA
jgi:hypothetical protein